MEYWDLYDYKGIKLEKIAIRGSKLNDDEFHLVVNAWIVNDREEFLITQRSENKTHPLKWECTGGSALIGEKSVEAAIREIKEELGIDIDLKSAIFIGRTRRYYIGCPDLLDVWLFKSNVKIEDIKIQEEEVKNVKWASKGEILSLLNDKKFEANAFINKVIELNKYPLFESKNNDIFERINSKNILKCFSEEKLISLKKDLLVMKNFSNELSLNVISIIGKYDEIIFPASAILTEKIKSKEKIIGYDFIYANSLDNKIKKEIKKVIERVNKKFKNIGYLGLISCDLVLLKNNNC